MMEWDIIMFRWLNSWAGVSPFFDWAVRFHATDLLYVFMSGLALFVAVPLFPRFRASLQKNILVFVASASSGVLARFVFVEAVRFFYNRPRPFETLEHVQQLIPHLSGGSFPSGHASFVFAVAAAISFYYPKTSLLFWAAALSISFARVASGVHWPSDILGGAAVGIISAGIVRLFVKRFWPEK